MNTKHAQELDRCRVPHFTGDFIFEHSDSYYWRVNGPVPLAVAQEIHRDPAADDIRVSGHAGRPAPTDPWITWRMPDGSTLADPAEEEAYDRMGLYKEGLTFSNDRSKATPFIQTYHIDTELGLRVFVDHLRWNGLLT